ncbi:hypothetical protein DFAR_970003 [Desulfarculales bacterium]
MVSVAAGPGRGRGPILLPPPYTHWREQFQRPWLSLCLAEARQTAPWSPTTAEGLGGPPGRKLGVAIARPGGLRLQ